MSVSRHSLAALLLSLSLAACTPEPRLPSLAVSGHSMGTSFEVLLIDPAADLPLDGLRVSIQHELKRIEAIASTYQESSEVSQFNRSQSARWFNVSDELCAMLLDATRVSRESAGAFDITVGSLVNLWGFGPDVSQDAPPADSELDAARATVGYENLEIDCANGAIRKPDAALKVDLSGWAKGYAVDRIAGVLSAAGQTDYLVEFGGEIKVRGHNAENKPFAIALENPLGKSSGNTVIVNASNTGIATSGDYRNYFSHAGKRYSHTIDPRTGSPVQHDLTAVTVIHSSTAYADAIATALLVLGPIDGLAFANRLKIDAYFALATSDGLVYFASDSFSAGRYLSNQASM